MASALDYYIALGDADKRQALMDVQARATSVNAARTQQIIDQMSAMFPYQIDAARVQNKLAEKEMKISDQVIEMFGEMNTRQRAADADALEADRAMDQSFEYLEAEAGTSLAPQERLKAKELYRRLVAATGSPQMAFEQAVSGATGVVPGPSAYSGIRQDPVQALAEMYAPTVRSTARALPSDYGMTISDVEALLNGRPRQAQGAGAFADVEMPAGMESFFGTPSPSAMDAMIRSAAERGF